MKNLLLPVLLIVLFYACICKNNPTEIVTAEKYKPTWSSLQKHQTPQWLKDAKFGIYTHVTLQTIANIQGNENKYRNNFV